MPWSHKDYQDAGWHRVTLRVPTALKRHLQTHTHAPLWQVLWEHFFPGKPSPPPPATKPSSR